MRGTQPADTQPHAGERGEDVCAGRVVEEFAELSFHRRVVRESPVTLDEIDEEQVVRQVGPVSERQQFGPRNPQQPHERDDDHGDEHGGIGAVPEGPACQPCSRRCRSRGAADEQP